jgi:peptidyl-prolyl cis-trans isomerase SurA
MLRQINRKNQENMKRFSGYIIVMMIWGYMPAMAQNRPGMVIDQIVGVVGDNIIMQSELEVEFSQLKKEFPEAPDSFKCEILRQRLNEKVLLAKAQLDSVELSEDRVNAELEKRIQYFARQMGGIKNMEEYYGKSIAEIKANNRDKIREGLLVQEMQQKALKDIKVSPTDIKKFFKDLEEQDSLPFYSAEVEIAQIVIQPKVSQEAKELAFEKISELRERVMNGENFNTLALIYSDDKGSAANGGELGFFTRGDMVPEFEAAAFRIKPDSISKIIESKFGYHILKLVDRKGDNINVRHILIRPKIFRTDIDKAKQKLDSILWLVKIDSLTFEQAAKKNSDDVETKSTGGFITEGQTGTTRVPIDELEKGLYFRIESMKPGDMSEPELITLPGPDREQAWRVLYLKTETKPHRANLKDDYQKFQVLAENKKKSKALADYISRHRKQVFISVSDEYKDCPSIQSFLKH